LNAQDQDPDLKQYMNRLFNNLNIETDTLGLDSFILHPGEQVMAWSLPGLSDEGMTVTFSRATALAHEDRQFLTWEHPMVRETMEQVIDQESGNSAAISYRDPQLKPGQLLLEGVFVLHCIAPRSLQAGRFLPPTLIRILINDKGERLDSHFSCDELTDKGKPLDTRTIAPVVRQYRSTIRRLVGLAEKQAENVSPDLISQAAKHMMESYTAEIQRMVVLRRHNPNVREEEIEALQAQGLALHQHLQAATIKLDAVRLVVTL
jgi:ATP-dependent helicase HepA